MKKATLIVTTHDHPDMLNQCLNLTHGANYNYRDKYELIVVDNASSNGPQIEEVCAKYNYRYLRADKNYAFSYANEIAIKASESEYIILVNDDLLPHQNMWIEKMVKFADARPKLAIEGVKLLYPNTNAIQHAGVFFNQYRQPYHALNKADLFDPRAAKPKSLQAVTGACMLIRRSAYNAVGGFTHSGEAPAYWYEDIDLCLKIREAGHEVWFNPDVVLYH